MITEKQQEILQKAISQYGTSAQLDMAVEECAELIQAVNKIKRAGLVGDHITKPNASMDIKSVNAYNNLCSEVADVKILLNQLELILCKERIQMSVDRKIDRLAVNHPSHYGGAENPYEAIKVIEAWDLNFNLGNTVKYISRAGKKDALLQELKKAAWYLQREIGKLEKKDGVINNGL